MFFFKRSHNKKGAKQNNPPKAEEDQKPLHTWYKPNPGIIAEEMLANLKIEVENQRRKDEPINSITVKDGTKFNEDGFIANPHDVEVALRSKIVKGFALNEEDFKIIVEKGANGKKGIWTGGPGRPSRRSAAIPFYCMTATITFNKKPQ